MQLPADSACYLCVRVCVSALLTSMCVCVAVEET